MKIERQLIEARHLLRKHVLLSTAHGQALTVRCMECGRNGADTPDGIYHTEDCRYAMLIRAFGGAARMGEIPQSTEPDKINADLQAALAGCMS